MAKKEIGKQSVEFECPPLIVGAASVVGEKEAQGPYGKYFDHVIKDPMAGQDTWEEAEERFQQMAAEMAIEKCGLEKKDIRYVVAGDLLGQLIASSFGLMNLDIPIFGVYGACSTMGESLAIGSMLVDGGFADRVVALTSSHFASAEKQFRFPLGYGNQRPKAATWTVTGSGAVVLSSQYDTKKKFSGKTNVQKIVQVRGVTTGKIVDYGVKDSMNMGACMAPAAADLIEANYKDFEVTKGYYDMIITGDLGYTGKEILLTLLKEKGIDISDIYTDCGIEVFDKNEQDTQSGGSGCGCSAIVLDTLVLDKLRKRELKRVLFVPTGALLSQVSFNEGKSIPGIAHGVVLEAV